MKEEIIKIRLDAHLKKEVMELIVPGTLSDLIRGFLHGFVKDNHPKYRKNNEMWTYRHPQLPFEE